MTPPASQHGILRFAAFEIDLDNRELRKRGLRVKLERQPFELLAALVAKEGQVVSREELRLTLWPDQPFGDHDHSLRKSVNKVRTALGDSAHAPRFLETLPGRGYRFSGPVELVDGRPPNVESDASSPSTFPARWDFWARISRRLLLPALAILAVSSTVTIALLVWGSNGVQTGPLLAPIPLTTYLGSQVSPSFSPDGQEVAFCWNGEQRYNFDIYVTRIGGARRRLTQDAARDYNPTWSPDGKLIAFVRESSQETAEIRVVPANGGQERLLTQIRPMYTGRVLAWTRNPRWLVIADTESPEGPRALSLLSIESGYRRRLTAPSGGFSGDQGPAVSPDGRRLAFTRFTSTEFQDIHVIDLTSDLRPAGEPRRLTDLRRRVNGVTWTADSRGLVFSAGGMPGQPFLHRIDAAGSGHVQNLANVNIEGAEPSLSPRGTRLVFVRRGKDQIGIWRLELPAAARYTAGMPLRVIASTGQDLNADVSPDGLEVAFVSNRSGSYEAWVAGIDGADPRQITRFGENGVTAPRWSPDGRQLVMESRALGQSQIYVVDVRTGRVRQLTQDPSSHILPNWSRDGRQIYFSSDRSGQRQIWKMPAAGGEATQVTLRGAAYAVEDFAGKFLYYTGHPEPACIRRVPVGGGEEVDVVPEFGGLSDFAVTEEGIYFLARKENAREGSICFFHFATGAVQAVAPLPRGFQNGLSATRDGRKVVWSQVDVENRDNNLMLVEGFR